MGTSFSLINDKILQSFNPHSINFSFHDVIPEHDPDNILLSLYLSNPYCTNDPTNTDHSELIQISEQQFVHEIQKQIFKSTYSKTWDSIDSEIHGLLIESFRKSLIDYFGEAIEDIETLWTIQNKLKESLKENMANQLNIIQSIFSYRCINSTENNQEQRMKMQLQQVSYFAIQSLSSIILLLIQSVAKTEPTIIHQVLTLTNQLCEQMPMKCLSSSVFTLPTHHFLSKSLKPLSNYITDLSLSNDPIIAKQALQILLHFAIAKGSFGDLLSLLYKLIFDTNNMYDAQGLFIQLNIGLEQTLEELELKKKASNLNTSQDSKSMGLDYLKSIGVYPNTKLFNIEEKQFTGQMISSIILAHVDFDHDNYNMEQYLNGSINSSFSFDFNRDTFKLLFNIIEQMIDKTKSENNPTITFILHICVKLFVTHLKFLDSLQLNINTDLFLTNDEWSKSFLWDRFSLLSKDINLNDFATETELQQWFQLFFKMASNDEDVDQLQSIEFRKLASQGLIYLLDKTTLSFAEKLSFMHKHIFENKHHQLIEQLWSEFNRKMFLLSWIENLCNENEHKAESRTALSILYSFIDNYINPTNHFKEDQQRQKIKELLLSFQKLLLSRIIIQSCKIDNISFLKSNDRINEKFSSGISTLMINYMNHIVTNYMDNDDILKNFLDPILLCLSILVNTAEKTNFFVIQPILTSFLPKVAEYVLQNYNNETKLNAYLYSVSWLLSRMSQYLIIGSSKSSLENKYIDQLNSILFINGHEENLNNNQQSLSDIVQSNLALYSEYTQNVDQQISSSDNDFLLSIFNQTGQGAKLIQKMHVYTKGRYYPLPKSIENLADDASTALFAVYIKHYRRVNLAKLEINRKDDQKPHHKLLSIFEYANHVRILFVKMKGQDGDCNQLYHHIKTKALFLLLNVKENHLIPIVYEDPTESTISTVSPATKQQKKGSKLKREKSRWTKAKHVIKILRNTLGACTRFKRLIKSKKDINDQEQDYETILHRLIDAFVYGDISKTLSLTTIEETKSILDDLLKAMFQQYERALIRLLTYRFNEVFLQKLLAMKDENQIGTILTIHLPRLKHVDVDWSYLENIPALNNTLKQEVGNKYYSCIKQIFSYALTSTDSKRMDLIVILFHLLNLSFQTIDIYHLNSYKLIETIFTSFISLKKKLNDASQLKIKFIAYNWFRLFVLRLCENIKLEEFKETKSSLLEEQCNLVFHQLIFNELKELDEIIETNTSDESDASSTSPEDDSLNRIALSWFLANDDSSDLSDLLSSESNCDLYLNQWLILLLRCIHIYRHARSVCTTIGYMEEFLSIYHRTQRTSSVILVLKILRYLIPYSSETTTGVTNGWIKTILEEIFNSISKNFDEYRIKTDISNELINFYRIIISEKSAWQSMAAQIILQSMPSNLNELTSLDSDDTNEMNDLSTSLCILGGYIQPYCLGSIVQSYIKDENLSGFYVALITETDTDTDTDADTDDDDDDSSETLLYFIEYAQVEKTEWVKSDKLKLIMDVPPPNLFMLLQANEIIHLILDKLGSYIQMDISQTDSISLLELKRRSIVALFRLLNDRKLVEIFMQKPYAPFLMQLAITSLSSKYRLALHDLKDFNKEHLEQYCLSLNRFKRKQYVENDNDDDEDTISDKIDQTNLIQFTIMNKGISYHNDAIEDALLYDTLKYNGWKPKASEAEIEFYKQGRVGNDEIVLVTIPRNIVDPDVFEEGGDHHHYRCRIDTNNDHIHAGFVTFIIDNLKVYKGKWYFCVKLSLGGTVQIGWGTNGFKSNPDEGLGIGDDDYSWAYDGSRHALFHNGEHEYPNEDTEWDEGDICGCGIEIDDEQVLIKYWLNGEFLGVAFASESYSGSATVKCNMKPNGSNTVYFPGISTQSREYSSNCCRLIVSPEDMTKCPLPDGYKPLLSPELINTENFIVPYPFSAYLVGDEDDNFFYENRLNDSANHLRDFVNGHHLETSFTVEDKHLILSETCDARGFSFPLNDLTSAITVSFDFKLNTSEDDSSDNNDNIQLFQLISKETYSIDIPRINDDDEETQIAIIFDPEEERIKLYINNKYRIVYGGLEREYTEDVMLHLLPNINAGIRNLAIWKYALTDEDVCRLFTYGLAYVAKDFEQINEYRQQVNMFIFNENQQVFSDRLLVPLDEPFEKSLWKTKRIEASPNESTYFKRIENTDRSTVQLFGNKTYLVLDLSSDEYSELTLILDVCVPNYPNSNEQLTLVTLDSELSIGIISDGRFVLASDTSNVKKSKVTLITNKYIRLVVSINEKSGKIYMNGSLVLEDDEFEDKINPIYLFRENDLTKNKTQDDTLRIECKLVSFLNRVIPIDDRMKSPEGSIDSLMAPPIYLILPSLIAIGYKLKWIELAIELSKTYHLQKLDTYIREHQQDFIEADLKNQHEQYSKVLSKLAPSIDKTKFENFSMSKNLGDESNLLETIESISTKWNDLQKSINSNDDKQDDQTSFIPNNLVEWLQNRSMNANDDNDSDVDQLFDLNKTALDSSLSNTTKSTQYLHDDLTSNEYKCSKMACEHSLILIYSREIVFNVLKHWSNNGKNLFELNKLADYSSIIHVLRLIDLYKISTTQQTNENIDSVNSIVKSIVTNEVDILKESIKTSNQLDSDIFVSKAPFINQLQKYIIHQLVIVLAKPSAPSKYFYQQTSNIDEQKLLKEPNLKFLLKMINIFNELIVDKFNLNQEEIDLIISFLFSEMLINLLFDLFLVCSINQVELFILHLFTS